MSINRSGYYKWKKRKDKITQYEQDRIDLTHLLNEYHLKHKAWGYRHLARQIRNDTGWMFSDNLAHKCCRVEGIHSKAKNYHCKKPGIESITYPNLISEKWNAKKPLEIIVSDMTIFYANGKHYEWTLLLDTFNNEILGHKVTDIVGSNKPYYYCLDVLKQLLDKRTEQTDPVVLHTDQGSVYSSRAFSEAHKNYTIKRSMSRVGTPTDNPIIESLNGWIKAELFLDFDLKHSSDVPKLLDEYVYYFNNQRLAAALNYQSPVQYRSELGL